MSKDQKMKDLMVAGYVLETKLNAIGETLMQSLALNFQALAKFNIHLAKDCLNQLNAQFDDERVAEIEQKEKDFTTNLVEPAVEAKLNRTLNEDAEDTVQ